jgi:gas vesicle protein
MEKNLNNTGKIVSALLVGAAVGAALGVLFAPNKGSETRKKIMAKGEDLGKDFKNKMDEMYESGKNHMEQVVSKKDA